MDFVKAYHELNRSLSPPAPETSWLSDIRHRGIQRFAELGLPNRKWEEWRYTSLSSLEKEDFSWPRPIVGLKDLLEWPEIIPWISDEEYRLVFQNGHFCQSLSKIDSLKADITITPISSLISSNDKNAEKIIKHIQSRIFETEDPFVALNQAFFYEGSVIWIPENSFLDRPVHIIHISKGENLFSHTRAFIVLENNSHVTLTESHFSTDSCRCLTTSVMDVIVGARAQLNMTRSFAGNPSAFHLGHVQGEVKNQSQLHLFDFSVNGALAKHNTKISITEPNSEVHLSGVYLVKKKQHVHNHTVIEHQAPNSVSQQVYKGILTDASRAVFDGKVIVRPDCAGTISSQINKNLLLSSKAEVDTKPQLEIYTDDVKCTHGATVGQLDEDELFYFLSRGIQKDAAIEMLARAFAEEIFFDLPDLLTQSRVRSLAQNFFCGLKWDKLEE